MDTTTLLIVGGVALIALLGVIAGAWSWWQRQKIRAHWKSIAAKGGATYKGGLLTHPMLEMKAGAFDVRLLVVTYKHYPDRVVVHITVPGLPNDLGIGRFGISHAVGRAISGHGGSQRLAFDAVGPGWEVRGDDALALPRYTTDGALVEGLRQLAALDPDATVEWTLIKYSTEDLPTDDAALMALIDVGLGVATPLARYAD